MSRFTVDKLLTITEENFSNKIKEIAPKWSFDAGKRPICGVELIRLQHSIWKGTSHEYNTIFTYITGFWVKDSDTQKTFIPVTWDTTEADDIELGKYMVYMTSLNLKEPSFGFNVRADAIQFLRFWSVIPWIKKNYDIMADTLLHPMLKETEEVLYRERKQVLIERIKDQNGVEFAGTTNVVNPDAKETIINLNIQYETIHFDDGYYLAGYGIEFNRDARQYIAELHTSNAVGDTKKYELVTIINQNTDPIEPNPASISRFGFDMYCKPSENVNMFVYKRNVYAATNKINQMMYPVPYSFIRSFRDGSIEQFLVKTECNVEETSGVNFMMIFILFIVFAGIVVAIIASSKPKSTQITSGIAQTNNS
jgi:hypothetical protein